MSENIILTLNDLENDRDLQSVLKAPSSMLDPRDSRLTLEQRKHILKERYEKQLIADGLETGHLRFDSRKNLSFSSKQSLSTFKGFVFEALLVRLINDHKETIGKKAFGWCTNRRLVQSSELDKYKAFGRGFKSTKDTYPGLHNATHKSDVQFFTINPVHQKPEVAPIVGTNIETGIQVKAITGNEYSEIIQPLLTGEYGYVLTCLRHSDNVHSYNKCMDLIKGMYRRGEIDHEQRCELESRIYSPEHLGIDQGYMDEYSYYVNEWYRGNAGPEPSVIDAANAEIKSYRYNGTILVPINMK